LFVLVELLLDELVSFPIWLFSHDHFGDSGFTFAMEEARASVKNVLGPMIRSEVGDFYWNINGVNMLGTLASYLQAASKWFSALPEADRASVLRATDELPHYADFGTGIFPFRHTQLWADTTPSDLNRIAGEYEEITRLVLQAEPASIRNGIDHWREPENFPTTEKMLNFAARFYEAVRKALDQRFLPKWLWLESQREDRFGRIEYELRDFAGGKVTLFGPQNIFGLPSPDFRRPWIVGPRNLLGHPNSDLLFKLSEPSQYAEYWKDYPERLSEATVSVLETESHETDAKELAATAAMRPNGASTIS
jgi:hypothetical protein